MIRRLPAPVLTSAAALAVSFGVLGWAVARAVTITLTTVPASPPQPTSAERPDSANGSAPTAMLAAVNADPFRADRRRPPRRFALPGTIQPARIAASAPALSLAGTVVYPGGGGVALVRMPGGTGTQLVRVGESIQGLTLRAVAPGEAVFARANGTTVVLRVPKAGG